MNRNFIAGFKGKMHTYQTRESSKNIQKKNVPGEVLKLTYGNDQNNWKG